ncbi:hypothetical protein BDZ45DRAFT_53768 [Acephala macrosclerotiorum]|nr:hypothetical protein BDZ45DRAFT_53768 [Acephala macrosclerotiorum]
MTCSVIMSFDKDTTIVGTSDKLNSVYPEIDANLLAGLAGFVNSSKKLNKFQAPVAKMFTWISKPIILNTFYISRDFHPGQPSVKEADYPERFSLSEDDYPERFTLTPKELQIPQLYRKMLPTTRQTRKVEPAPTSAPVPAPPAPGSAAEQLKQFISKEDLEALVKQYVVDQLQSAKANLAKGPAETKKVVAKTPEPQPAKESEPEEDTIVVDVPSGSSDSEEDEPITPRNKSSRLQAAKDELLAALLAESGTKQKSKKGKKASPSRSVTQATKDLTSDEESPAATRTRGAKRARSTESSGDEPHSSKRSRSASTDCTDDEPLARSTRSAKRSKQSECSDKDTPRASRPQTRKTKTVAQPTRSLRSRGRA